MSKSSFFTNSGAAQTTQLAFAEANDSILAALSRAETAAATAESSAATLSGSATTVTGLINGFSADLSAAENANATAIAQQASLTAAQAQLTTDLGTIDTKIADATKLANNPLEAGFTLSTDDVGATSRYSALHYASKAETAKGAAETAKTDAETAKTGAETAKGLVDSAKADAEKFASHTADSLFTLSDGVTTGYSALHYNSLAETAKTGAENAKEDAEKIASNTKGSQFTLSDGETTGYSALHYQDLAEKFAVNAGSFIHNDVTYQSALTSANRAKDFAESDDIFAIDGVEHVSAKQWATASDDITIGETTYKSAKAYAQEIESSNTALDGRLDEFALVYQGAFTTQPTTRNDESALQEKDLYYDLIGNTLLIYRNSAWVDFFEHPTVIKDSWTYNYTSPSGPHDFTGPDISGRSLYIGSNDYVEVYVNGIKERQDSFSVEASTNTVTINGDLPDEANMDVVITVYKPYLVENSMQKSGGTFEGPVNFDDRTTHSNVVQFDFNVPNSFTYAPIDAVSISVNDSALGALGISRVLDQETNSAKNALYIEARNGAADTALAGLSFDDEYILPRYTHAVQSDMTNLGKDDAKFKSGHFVDLFGDNLKTEDIKLEGTSDLKVTFNNGTKNVGEIKVNANGDMHINDGIASPVYLNGGLIGSQEFELKDAQYHLDEDKMHSLIPDGNHGIISLSATADNFFGTIHYYNVTNFPGQLTGLSVGTNVHLHSADNISFDTEPSHLGGEDGKLNVYYRNTGTPSTPRIYFVNRSSLTLNVKVRFL